MARPVYHAGSPQSMRPWSTWRGRAERRCSGRGARGTIKRFGHEKSAGNRFGGVGRAGWRSGRDARRGSGACWASGAPRLPGCRGAVSVAPAAPPPGRVYQHSRRPSACDRRRRLRVAAQMFAQTCARARAPALTRMGTRTSGGFRRCATSFVMQSLSSFVMQSLSCNGSRTTENLRLPRRTSGGNKSRRTQASAGRHQTHGPTASSHELAGRPEPAAETRGPPESALRP